MRSKRPEQKADADLYRARLDNLLDHRHELFQLAEKIDWDGFEEAFGRFYKPVGRPAKPTRLMVALSYLKHIHDLSDEEVVARWVENPYWQWFSGFAYFQHQAPIDPSLLSRWRKRIGPEGLERLLAETVRLGVDTGVVKPSSLQRLSVDTTVQPKAIAHPTDSRLYHKALEVLVRQAKRAGITLRQAHTRLAKTAAIKAGRYAHARQYRRMKRELRRLRTYLGRVYRDVGRKIAGDETLQARFSRLLGLVERLLAQQPKDKNKLYALHAPEVACIAKGKARTPYEFGCKVGIAATNREDFVVAAKAFEGNPYDGHTLAETLAQAEAMSGVAAERVYVDRGYRGHDVADKERVYVAGRKRGVTPTIRRELRRRSSIEAAIGHMKTDGRLDRNYLLGTEGDAVNALLAAAGYNLRQILRHLRLLFALLMAWLTAQTNTAPATPTR
jgi:IS5 family transposase